MSGLPKFRITENGIVVVFGHPKGGTGKSTVLWNYALWLQSKGKKFTIIDLDGQNTVTRLNRVRIAEGLEPLDIITFDTIKALSEYLEDEENSSKDILIDTGGYDSKINRVATLYSDLVVVPVAYTAPEALRVLEYPKIFDEILEERRKFISTDFEKYLLLNRVNSSQGEKTLDEIKDNLNPSNYFDYMDNYVYHRMALGLSGFKGQSLSEYAPKNKKHIKELVSVFKELTKKIKNI